MLPSRFSIDKNIVVPIMTLIILSFVAVLIILTCLIALAVLTFMAFMIILNVLVILIAAIILVVVFHNETFRCLFAFVAIIVFTDFIQNIHKKS